MAEQLPTFTTVANINNCMSTPESSMVTLFVYGTLKQGDCRHEAIRDQRFLGEAQTTACCRLFDLGGYPALIADENGNVISGELYAVDPHCVERLDVIEGVVDSLYHRETINLSPPWDDQIVQTYFYQRTTDGFPEIRHWTVTPDPT